MWRRRRLAASLRQEGRARCSSECGSNSKFAISLPAFAQQTPTPPDAAAAGQGRGGRGGGFFSQPTPSDWNDHEGWKQIFDGRTLEGWHCDPEIWKVEDGMFVARSTVEKPVGTSYCTWMGGEPADFENEGGDPNAVGRQ